MLNREVLQLLCADQEFQNSTYHPRVKRWTNSWLAVEFASWPLRMGKFSLWLALLNCCWTASRLPKWGLPHPSCCLLCDQRDEIMQRLLISHVFLWQVWFFIVQQVRLEFMGHGRWHRLAPPPYVSCFQDCGADPSDRWTSKPEKPSIACMLCCLFLRGLPLRPCCLV